LLEEGKRKDWHEALQKLGNVPNVHGLVQGKVCRLLSDSHLLDKDETVKRFSLALSQGNEPAYSAAWLEGFLGSSGTILLMDNVLWGLMHQWLAELNDEIFTGLLPLIRRSFTSFSSPERRKLGEKAKNTLSGAAQVAEELSSNIDHARGARVFPLISQLLGLELSENRN
jgi:hypothetical protein